MYPTIPITVIGGHSTNGDSVDDILLDSLLTLSLFHVSDNVSHTGFIAHESGKMNWLRLVVLGVGSDSSLMMLGSSLWKITQMAISWMLEFSLYITCKKNLKVD